MGKMTSTELFYTIVTIVQTMQCRATGVKVNHVQMINIDQGKTLPLASQKYEKSSDMHA